ncbi:MAG: DUF2218 domain-containing protein [Rhodobacteraceae bacterium]|nr:DUF2218 domain-containing protein [Paracoccaceae bacterium]
MGSKAFAYVPPGGGENFNWSLDDIFVKVSSQDTLGQYTVIEDNLKANFSLGLHYHRYHAETFYILEGSVDFDSQAGRIEFPFGIAELNAEELGLNMIAKAETAESLDKMKHVLASHLERFAFREKLECNWDK